MERINYSDFGNGFETVVLEESFVLNLKTTMSFVEFQMNFAVNDKYPLYVKPEKHDQGASPHEDDDSEFEVPEGFMQEGADEYAKDDIEYPYRKGRIFFPNMEQVTWVSRIQPYIDPRNGLVDYGSIDYFYQGEEGRYYLAGYWGELEISSGKPLLEIDELKEQYQNQPKANNQANPRP
jgi:hypothetical protein